MQRLMTHRLIVTGGAGFIGANLVHFLLEAHPTARLVIVDKLTYAGNTRYLGDALEDERVTFVEADIADLDAMRAVFDEHDPLAAPLGPAALKQAESPTARR